MTHFMKTAYNFYEKTQNFVKFSYMFTTWCFYFFLFFILHMRLICWYLYFCGRWAIICIFFTDGEIKICSNRSGSNYLINVLRMIRHIYAFVKTFCHDNMYFFSPTLFFYFTNYIFSFHIFWTNAINIFFFHRLYFTFFIFFRVAAIWISYVK